MTRQKRCIEARKKVLGPEHPVSGYNYGASNVQCLDFQSLPLTAETGATCGWY
jgi:hypothetical protein